VYGDGATETFRYRADGALLEAVNDTVAVALERDQLGRVTQERQGPHTVTSEYDLLGYRVGVTSSLGATVRYTRDLAGNIEQIKAGEWQALFVRDAQGLELQRRLSGGVQVRWKRDALGRPTEQRIRTGNTRVAERVRSYGWQENDRLSSIQDSLHGLTRFEHDAVGNLAATTFADGTRELRLPDAVGNLFRTADQQDRRYGPAGQLLEAKGTRYAYDALGNLSKKILRTGQEWHYSWNSSGHLAEVVRPDGGVVRFQYDALGRRVSKSYKGRVTRWVWDGNKPLHEWSELEIGADKQAASEVLTWLFEDGSFAPLAKLQGREQQSILADHLGTPVQMHDRQGQQVWTTELDSYGRVRRQEGETLSCPFRYQGQYQDIETGLYYNRFRYYDPKAGQYISQDPIGLVGGNPSMYGYVKDPNTWLDPLGLFCEPPSKIKLTSDGVQHVKDRHIGNKAGWEHKSKWTTMNGEWKTKTRQTFRKPDRVSRDGDRWVFEKEFKDPVGIDRDGNSLYKVRVITESQGDLVTSFPQMDWK
jgi:RHS repeat-associated protein